MTGSQRRTYKYSEHLPTLCLDQENLGKRAGNPEAEEQLRESYHSSAKDTSGCSRSCRPGSQGQSIIKRLSSSSSRRPQIL